MRRTIFWNARRGSVAPLDTLLGIDRHRYSPGVREMCCRLSQDSSFDRAGGHLQRTAQLSISEETLRRLVQAEGQLVQTEQHRGALGPDFTSADCTDETLLTGTDGVMVPLVTDVQKQKRRATEAIRRAAQGRRSTAKAGRPRRGSDGAYKEFKLVSFYDKDKSHCHVVGTSGDHHALGRLMRREACRLQFGKAKHKYAVSDGAAWIERQYRIQLPMLDEHILDYYHLQEHVLAAGQVLYGEGTAKARAWVEDMMGYVWNQGSLVMLDRLGPYLRRHRSGAKHEALKSLYQFVAKRIAMTDYPTFRAKGYDCGSGPTESCCGTLTRRLKGPGMRWDKDNAESMMALAALRHSNLWNTYWNSQRAA